jgi:hypothetical protein
MAQLKQNNRQMHYYLPVPACTKQPSSLLKKETRQVANKSSSATERANLGKKKTRQHHSLLTNVHLEDLAWMRSCSGMCGATIFSSQGYETASK